MAIRVENLGKRYRITHSALRSPYRTLRESLVDLAATPLRRLSGRASGGQVEDFWALRDVNIEIKQGEVVGVIGRNGAGKSTLLKILSRIAKPTTGRAELQGRVGSLLEVGTGFHPELTGRENIYLNGAILGMSRAEIQRNFDAIVDFSGVEEFLDTPVKRYSSGMQVRLAFSVAAHLDPEIMIVDEVLAVGDAEFQRRCLGQMRRIARSGRTVLFVSHNMAAVEGLCRRGIVLDAGRVAFTGTQTEAIGRYMEIVDSQVPRGFLKADAGLLDGAGRVARIVEARVTSGGGYDPAGYPAGAPLEFHVVALTSRPVAHPSLGVGIDDGLGQRIVTLHTDFGPCRRQGDRPKGRLAFMCRVGGLALRPGDYRVKLNLEGDGGTLQCLEDALMLSILPCDFYRNGGKFGKGAILCAQDWQIQVLE
jgi:lipopolysaccharide transport system ATP-binding protein